MYRVLFDGPPSRQAIGELKKGQLISVHATPAFDFDPPRKWEETSLETANIFVASQPEGDILGEPEQDTDIIVRSDLVELSYRVMNHPGVRERFPHLFQDDEPGTPGAPR